MKYELKYGDTVKVKANKHVDHCLMFFIGYTSWCNESLICTKYLNSEDNKVYLFRYWLEPSEEFKRENND
jgi:hypothetical protein